MKLTDYYCVVHALKNTTSKEQIVRYKLFVYFCYTAKLLLSKPIIQDGNTFLLPQKKVEENI